MSGYLADRFGIKTINCSKDSLGEFYSLLRRLMVPEHDYPCFQRRCTRDGNGKRFKGEAVIELKAEIDPKKPKDPE